MMKMYKVRCGMRKGSDGAWVALPTMYRTVTVRARDAADARGAAIDECYRLWGNSIEHVQPRDVTEIEESAS